MAARFLGVAAAAALLSGCASPVASTQVDPNSPVADEVARVATANKAFPRFTDIPPAPTDVTPPQVLGERARELVAARDALQARTAPDTWSLSNTATFAAQARADAGPDVGPPAKADTEAFAAEARRRATPPPPATR